MRALARVGIPIGVVLALSAAVHAQTGVKVELEEVVDNRVTAGQFGGGSLDLRVKLNGTGLDKASAARVIIKDAKDDRGTVLSEGLKVPDFTPRDYNMGTLQASLKGPARAASSVKVKGTVELFVPTRDPNAMIKIDKALSKLDTPLSSKALKAAKVEITPLSPAGYAAAMKSRKIDEKAIEEIRAAGKKAGAPEKEIELAIELAKAFEGLDSEPAPGSILLSGKTSDFEKIYRIEILGADGQPIDTSSRSTSSRGESSLMTLQPSGEVPAGAAMQIFLVTDKSKVSFPFELNVQLP